MAPGKTSGILTGLYAYANRCPFENKYDQISTLCTSGTSTRSRKSPGETRPGACRRWPDSRLKPLS